MKRTTHLVLPDPVEVALPPHLTRIAGLEPDARRYRMGDCSVIVGSSTKGWHLSIAHPSRYPTWDEIAHARYKLVPGDVTMAMLLPPMTEYVNFNPTCFHLWQVPNDIDK